ncbi:MAG: carbohydrate binding family 9 domain-containing protein [Chitinophagaceae bacterium]|nr:carbohydrate binding family 9 domain-containing protein [Chitinophagaceae bacterium]
MKNLFLFICINCIGIAVGAQERNLAALKINSPIKVDGILDEAVWQQAAVADSFIVNSPKYGEPAKHPTKVRILYSDQAVYVGAYLYDDPKKIRKQLTSRDGEQRQDIDYFSVFFDTYNDNQNGFQFLVTARNVQSDGRLVANRVSQFGLPTDYSWDAVWESKVTIQKDGWVVEMKIPYSALRFSKKEVQDWGINFQRYTRRTNESAFWNNVDPNQNGFVNQFGNLTGIKNIEPPLRLSFLPYITTGVRNTPHADGSNSTTILRNGGMDLKYGVNESFTLDATLIPDYGQVVSDNVVLNLTPYEVQFQENRPFFTEGIELFNKAGLFYSRRVGGTPANYFAVKEMVDTSPNLQALSNPGITQLYNAMKFSGRNQSKLGIGVFNAVAASMHAEVLDKATGKVSTIETEPLTNYNIIVLDQALKGRSSFTFTNTNVWRSGGTRNANVSGLDLNLFDKKNRYNFIWQARYSSITGVDKHDGYKQTVGIAKVSGNWQWGVSNNIESERYDPNDLGYLRAPNEFSASGRIGYYIFKPTKHFLSQNYSVSVSPVYLYTPFKFSTVTINGTAFWFLNNFYDFTFRFTEQPVWQKDFFEMRTAGKVIKREPYWFAGVSGSSDSRRSFFVRYGLGYAEAPGFAADSYYTYEIGSRYRFNTHFSMDFDISKEQDNGQYGYAYHDTNNEPVAGRRKNVTMQTVLSGIYNFNPRMNITMRARHYWSQVLYSNFFYTDANGDYIPKAFEDGHNQNFNAFNLDMFYTWDFKYGSKLIVGWKNGLGSDFPINGTVYNKYTQNLSQVFQQPHGNEFNVRFIYYIDYLTLQKKQHS